METKRIEITNDYSFVLSLALLGVRMKSVYRLARSWMVRGSNPGRGKSLPSAKPYMPALLSTQPPERV